MWLYTYVGTLIYVYVMYVYMYRTVYLISMLKAKHPIPWSWQEKNTKMPLFWGSHLWRKPNIFEPVPPVYCWQSDYIFVVILKLALVGRKKGYIYIYIKIWATSFKKKLLHLLFYLPWGMWEYATEIHLSMGFWMRLTWQCIYHNIVFFIPKQFEEG